MEQKANYIKEILKNNDIVSILSLFLNIQKSGNGFFALCPFHKENTPSFYINKDKQKYYCFGCTKHGNIIDFVSEYKKCNVNDAIKIILKNSNLVFPIKKYKQNDTKTNDVLSFFNMIVIKSFLSTNDIKEFLEKRHLDHNIIKLFNIGFVPSNLNFFFKKDIYNNIIIALNKLGFFKQDENKLYNRFRNRIIFPIKNLKGVVVGLGGRTIYEGIKPKYINSPESQIFSKKKELYGLYESLLYKNVNNAIIIVEGYFDVITLHKNGIYNVAALLGTSLSQEHLAILKSLYKKIIFCFDGDTAGKLAALRSAYLCLPSLLDFTSIKFAIMPNGLDPDSFINKYGKDQFIKLINNAIFILDFILIGLNFTDYKKIDSNFLFKLNQLLSKINNNLTKTFFINYVFNTLNLKKIKNNYPIKTHVSTLNLAIKACFLLLKNKSLFFCLDLEKIIMNKNIHFNSEFNIFLEILFLLKHDFSLSFSEINKRLIKKIKLNNLDFIYLINKMPKDILRSEFLDIINKNLTN